MRVERFEAVVIGAGQAGLAAGYHLARHDVDFVILDGASRLGNTWWERWDSLRLFTPAGYSGLPGMPFPAPAPHLPAKDEVAEYLFRMVPFSSSGRGTPARRSRSSSRATATSGSPAAARVICRGG